MMGTGLGDLERLTLQDGSKLLERDLDGIVAYEALLQQLHVSATHRTWGVAVGLVPLRSNDRRRVLVSPGHAYTRRGQPLVFKVAETIPAPARTSGAIVQTFDLVVRPAKCSSVALPSLQWVSVSGATSCCDDVVLGRFALRSDGTLAPPDLSVRYGTRRHSRPYIAQGTVSGGTLIWTGEASAITARIDTSAASFSAIPLYFATLAGMRAPPAGVIGPFQSIASDTSTGFTLRLRFVGIPARTMADLYARVDLLLANASVIWTGVENMRGCALLPTLPEILSARTLPEIGAWADAIDLLMTPP